MVSLIQILKWFVTDAEPTESQFRDTWTSFWHKSERLPQSQVLGLNDALNELNTNKVDRDELINLGVGIKGYGDDVQNIADLQNVPDKYEGLAVVVINDKDASDNSFVWLYDGAKWGRTPYTTLPKDVIVKNDVQQAVNNSDNPVSSNAVTNKLRIVDSSEILPAKNVLLNSYIGTNGDIKPLVSTWVVSLYDISAINDIFIKGEIAGSTVMSYGFYNSENLSSATLIAAGDIINSPVQIEKTITKPGGATILAVSQLTSNINYPRPFVNVVFKDVVESVDELFIDMKTNPYARESETIVYNKGEIIASSSVIANSHLNLSGIPTNIAASWRISIYPVTGLSNVYLKGKIRSGGSLAWAFYNSDTINATTLIQKGDAITDNINITDIDKVVNVPSGALFIAVSQLLSLDYTTVYNVTQDAVKVKVQEHTDEIQTINNKIVLPTETLKKESEVLPAKFIQADGGLKDFFALWEVAVYDITGDDAVLIYGEIISGGTMAYGFYNSSDITAVNLVQAGDYITNNSSLTLINKIVNKPDGATHLAVSRITTHDYIKVYNDLKYEELRDVVKQNTDDIKKLMSVYLLLLALGDSLSTKDNYKWKGMLETDYGLRYVRDGALPPAVGGIPLIPPINEISGGESIWYRCANQRMNIYAFDIISLFGGTNDIVDTNLDIGAINDAPYLDTTATRPETVTYAAALMGCIEMLQRDFPNIPIVICTILQGGRGQWIYKDTGKKSGQVMAEMQLAVATKYNLRCVDMYFSSGITYDNYRIFTPDSVHFNLQGAIKMKNNFALTMAL